MFRLRSDDFELNSAMARGLSKLKGPLELGIGRARPKFDGADVRFSAAVRRDHHPRVDREDDFARANHKISAAGAGFRSLTEAVDTTSPAGRMVMQILGGFAELERSMIRERTRDAQRMISSMTAR